LAKLPVFNTHGTFYKGSRYTTSPTSSDITP
jgi:hypothetical protein